MLNKAIYTADKLIHYVPDAVSGHHWMSKVVTKDGYKQWKLLVIPERVFKGVAGFALFGETANLLVNHVIDPGVDVLSNAMHGNFTPETSLSIVAAGVGALLGVVAPEARAGRIERHRDEVIDANIRAYRREHNL